MARSRGSARPAVRSSPAQTRSASTVAAPSYTAPPPSQQHPSAYSQPPAQVAQPQQPGMFAQMATTAAGVAVGSAVGHTLGAGISSLFGGSSSAPAEQVQVQQPQQQLNQEQTRHCDVDARNFTRCLENNSGDYQICDYYLQQLKACQEAARQY